MVRDARAPSDEQLAARCRAELPYRTAAFEQLVRRYEPVVYRTCQQYLGNDHDAEEVSQDVFLKVFHGLPRFEGRSALRTWLFRIVQNECATRYRQRQSRRRMLEQFQASHAAEPRPATGAPAPRELTGLVGQVMDRLSDTDRTVLVLRHVAELPLQDVADALDISLSAAKMRLYRAEERFRKLAETPGPVM